MENFSSQLLAILILPLLSNGFHFHVPTTIGTSSRSLLVKISSSSSSSANNKNDIIRCFSGKEDSEMNLGPGMEDAFKELDALKSLGGDDNKIPEMSEGGKAKKKDEAFAKAIESLDLKDILSQAEAESSAGDVTPESEVELYMDMASEVDVASSDDDLIAADFKNDLELADNKDDLPIIDTQKFMDKAIQEALKEAKEKDNSVSVDDAKEAFLDNKEIMSEIEKIFDKANDDLLEELEEIRVEQAALAKEQAERNSKKSLENIEETEKRMEVAQSNMKKMLERVNAETKAVEEAVEDLRRAQAASDGGIESQLVDLKSGGIVKQAFLAGGLLFALRGGAETVAFLAGDPSHVLPALVQGVLAIICIAGFVFL